MHCAVDLALGTTGVYGPAGVDRFDCPSAYSGGVRLRWWYNTLAAYYRASSEHGCDTAVVGRPVIYAGRENSAVPLLKLHGISELVAVNFGLRYVEVWDTEARAKVIGKGSKKPDVLPWARANGYELDDDDGDIADAILFHTLWADNEFVRGRSAPVISDSITKARG